MKPIWANPIEEAAWRETWCRRCFQTDEARKRVMGSGDGCPLLALAATNRLPAQWKRRRNAVMGYTYTCSDFLKQPPVNRRTQSTEETPAMFDVDSESLYTLIPVPGWPDYHARRRNKGPEKL